jgi:hypothetical protein
VTTDVEESPRNRSRPIRTVNSDGAVASPSSLSSTTCSSSASSTGWIESGKSWPNLARLEVPASTTRSSRRSTIVSSSTEHRASTAEGAVPPPARPVGRSAKSSSSSGTSASGARDPRVQPRPQVGERALLDRRRAVDLALLDPAGVGDQHQHHPARRQPTSSTCRTESSGERRVLDDRDLPGELREQPHRAVDDVVEVDRAVQELWIALRSGHVIGLTVESRSTNSR